jgi:type IV pilus assembly protein PilW
MVSMAIGVVVVAAVLVTYIASRKTGRQQVAYSEMNENAQMALGLISRDLLLAGYAQPSGYNTTTDIFTKTYSGRPVFGCDNGFATPNSTNAVACAATATNPAIEITYEADLKNTIPTSSNVPSDCIGNGLSSAGTLSGVDYYIAYNRYYLSSGNTGRSELHCASRQGGTGQPLVDNVESMKFWYGEANSADPRTIVRYVSAGNVTDWGLIVSVRVCVLLRSSEVVLNSSDDTLTYLNCDSTQQTSSDLYLRRAYFSTTTLRNKMGL